MSISVSAFFYNHFVISLRRISCRFGRPCGLAHAKACKRHTRKLRAECCSSSASGAGSVLKPGALPGFVSRPAGRRERRPTHSCRAPTLLRYARPLSHANVAAISALLRRYLCIVNLRARGVAALASAPSCDLLPISPLTCPLRVTGSSSPTRVVSMSVMSMRRLRSSSSPSISRNTPQTRRLPPLS